MKIKNRFYALAIGFGFLAPQIALAQTFAVREHLRKTDPQLLSATRSLYGCDGRSCAKIPDLRLTSSITPQLAELMRSADATLKTREPENTEPDTCGYDFALWGAQEAEFIGIKIVSVLKSPSKAEVGVELSGTNDARIKKSLLFSKINNRWLLDDIIDRYSLKNRLIMDIEVRCYHNEQ